MRLTDTLPKVAPDGLPAAVLLSFLATAGLFYVNIMAALVTGLSDGLGIKPASAGLIASANVYGAAVGALIAVFLVRRIPWRIAATSALVGLIAVDLVSTQLVSVPGLTVLRACHGMIGGLLVGIAFAVIARTRSPDRVFGMLLVVQFGIGGIGLWALPPLVPEYGTGVLFLALAAFSLATLAMLPFLPAYPVVVESAGAAEAPPIARKPLAATLAAIFLFQAGNMGLAAFIIGLGRGAGLSQDFIGPTLAAANWLGAVGSILVVAMGARFGRARPILGSIAVTLIFTAAFWRSDLPAVYVAANIGSAIVWAFTIPYLLGLAAAFDKVGRTAALGGFCSKLGLASGPLLTGLLLDRGGYPLTIVAAVLLLLASGLAAAWPARLLDRAQPSQA
ncbi:MFS transporter [Sphingopyxis sp. DBS4]|jgi:predicted MFS family arabinose efflux permease|uniref:MFS transporter n=1 Tax=Sphingopyxis sp. DBS4 TaxID=2968500 RepID=UPI00214B5155|nr:MFS transporter [Sphingopyxis sp. DBS4]